MKHSTRAYADSKGALRVTKKKRFTLHDLMYYFLFLYFTGRGSWKFQNIKWQPRL